MTESRLLPFGRGGPWSSVGAAHPEHPSKRTAPVLPRTRMVAPNRGSMAVRAWSLGATSSPWRTSVCGRAIQTRLGHRR